MLAAGAVVFLLTANTLADAAEGRRERRERASQPHSRTTERQRTENGRSRTDTVTRGDASASRSAVITRDTETASRTRDVTYQGFDGQTRQVDHSATRTDDGYTRVTSASGPNGTATRQVEVSRDPESGARVRAGNDSARDGGTGSRSSVIQRTEDGYSREVTHTTPDGVSHTRHVDVSCDKDVNKCVRQVDVGQQP